MKPISLPDRATARYSAVRRPGGGRAQRGVTLIELLVGLSIGLMTIAVALGALVVSRGLSGTVSDASQIQQQAAHALRVIGMQLRQAGSVRLNLAFGQPAPTPDGPVLFEFDTDPAAPYIRPAGTAVLTVGYQNYTEEVVGSATPKSLLRDCLGAEPSATLVQSNFQFVKAQGAATGDLQCVGASGSPQVILSNVADFQVRYLLQGIAVPATVQRVAAAGVTDWRSVVGVEVCMEIVGEETVDTASATYRNCSWTSGAEASMGNRMRLVFRNTFHLRSRGLQP